MTAVWRRSPAWILAALLVLALAPSELAAQSEEPAPFKPEELEQIVAPIALYPDSLLAQVMMASTYPLEIVQADRWVKANPGLEGKALEDALQQQPWDPSVKSMTAVPQVLTMMSEKLDWTQKLGDAFLAQEKDVMDAVQRLRAKAKAEGHLESTKEQVVVEEQVPATQTTVIKVEQANPQVVYVPTYNPVVVYGAWPYPAYPPYYYYPPGYVAAASFVSFGVGMAVGSAMWGNCNWGHGDVDVNVKHYNEFNRSNIDNSKWQHNAEHRKGVGYRDNATQNRYGRQGAGSAQTREQFRGRGDQGRGGTGGERVATREGAGAGGRGASPSTADRSRAGGAADRGRSSGAFEGMGNGAQTRQDSARGNSSRQSASSWGSRSGGGGTRSGGMSRGGGGRGGGGRGGRR